jgi:hypothetical protein
MASTFTPICGNAVVDISVRDSRASSPGDAANAWEGETPTAPPETELGTEPASRRERRRLEEEAAERIDNKPFNILYGMEFPAS